MSEAFDDEPLSSGPVVVSALAFDDSLDDSEAPDERDDEPGLGTREIDRYEEGALLGRGGMGEVRSVVDHRLGRLVARKVARGHEPNAQARLAREARITARLEHPGIVPVYDAGWDDDGNLYYTMRIIRGRTLASVLTESGVPAPAALLRHFLDACTAVAYAHQVGVIHRDLTPANILVGEFGETQVADWGLALELDEGPTTAAPAGTPAYMSPEQFAGQPVDRRCDVWALGAVLFELLTGVPPLGRIDSRARRALSTIQPQVRDADPGTSVAPDLAAIAERALHPDPAQRYPDAGHLARELARWIDGRTVAAYAYTPWELAVRLLRAWRAPVAVAAVASLLLLSGGAVAWQRDITAREQAEQAEVQAEQARRQADDNLARTLVVRARELERRGRRAHAEVLAAHALELRESPAARGILAAGTSRDRPRLLSQKSTGCLSTSLDAHGDIETCVTEHAITVTDTSWSVPASGLEHATLLPKGQLAVTNEARQLVLHYADGHTDPPIESIDSRWRLHPIPGSDRLVFASSRLVFVDPGQAIQLWHQPCSQTVMQVHPIETGQLLTTCSESTVLLGPGDAPAQQVLAQLPPGDGRASSLDYDATHRIALVGTLRGVVHVVDISTGEHKWRAQISDRAIAQVRAHPSRSSTVAVQVWRGETLVVDLSASRVLHRLPAAPVEHLTWREGGEVLRRIGPTLEDWELPPTSPVDRFGRDAGVASIAASPVDGRIAVGYGSGDLDVRGPTSWSSRWQEGVLKDVAISTDGQRLLASGVREPALRVLDAGSGRELAYLASRPCNRVLWLGDTLVGVAYSHGPQLWRADALDAPARRVSDGMRFIDAENRGPDRALLLDNGGVLWWLEPDADPAMRRFAERPAATAVAPWSRGAATTEHDRVVLLDAQGRPLRELVAKVELLEVDVSPDDRWVVASAVSGMIFVWDSGSGQQPAVLDGHRDRVTSLAFIGPAQLVSGGWDGRVRHWELSVLDQDPTRLRTQLEQAWGLDLARALDG